MAAGVRNLSGRLEAGIRSKDWKEGSFREE
jgi:hypothetical protein